MTIRNHSVYKSVRTTAGAAAFLLLAPIVTTLTLTNSTYAQTPATLAEASGTYGVDKPHSDISFTVTHMAITKVHGRFNDFDGTVKMDGKNPENSSVEFTIKTASINTDNAQRDTHLKSPAFFDAEKNPDITFKSSRINKRKNGYEATGLLTMHGVSKEIMLPFTVVGPVPGMDKAKTPHIGVEIALNLKRSDYGITYGPGVVSDDVAINIDLDLVKQ